jgi:hypothetical protein
MPMPSLDPSFWLTCISFKLLFTFLACGSVYMCLLIANYSKNEWSHTVCCRVFVLQCEGRPRLLLCIFPRYDSNQTYLPIL